MVAVLVCSDDHDVGTWLRFQLRHTGAVICLLNSQLQGRKFQIRNVSFRDDIHLNYMLLFIAMLYRALSILGQMEGVALHESHYCLTILICVTVGSSAARVSALSPVCCGSHDACSLACSQPDDGTHAHCCRVSPNDSAWCWPSIAHTDGHSYAASHCQQVAGQVIASQ